MKTLKTFKTLTEGHHIEGLTDTQILREVIIEEMKAVNLYERMADEAMDGRVRTLLLDLAKEEKVHGAEAEELLERLDPDFEETEEQAEEEVESMFGSEDED